MNTISPSLQFLRKRVRDILSYPDKDASDEGSFLRYLEVEYAHTLHEYNKRTTQDVQRFQMDWLALFTLAVGLLAYGKLDGIEFIFNDQLYLPREAQISSLKRDAALLLPFPTPSLNDEEALAWVQAHKAKLTWDVLAGRYVRTPDQDVNAAW